MIDVRIRTFLTLYRLMNYRKTAEELNMTQPAVTQHIHYLENQYHCKLFLYDRKTLKCTPQAELLKEYAENVLYQEKKLTGQLHPTKTCHLSIGATKTIGEYVISEQISNYLKNPNHHISVDVDNTEHLLQSLSKGEIDFALIEGFFDRKQFASRLYRQEPFVGICGKQHPFAGKTIPLQHIWNQHLILREEGSGTRNILAQLLTAENHSFLEFERITTLSNFGLLTRLLEKGQEITFAYQALSIQNPNLSEFKIEGWDILREFNYVYLDTPFSHQAVNFFDSFRSESSPVH